MKRQVGIALGAAAIALGVLAAFAAIKTLFVGVFVAIVGAPVMLLAVLAAVLVLLLPFVLGGAAIVASRRRPDGSTAGVVLGGVALGIALVAGPTFFLFGERVAPSPLASRATEAARPAPANCVVETTDTSAINRVCTVADDPQGSCPKGYLCSDTMARLTGDTTKPQHVCEIPCVHPCACPPTTKCRNATCQRGNDLPP